jgi:ubiquinone/menaquinone biosynthesis C-methylase UbiE
MSEATRADRAVSFGQIAEYYDRFRPGPPAAAVEWVLPSPRETALDLGAGTGALTRRLVERAAQVVAIEPDSRMLKVLSSRSPQVGAVRARAEQLPIAASTTDAVMVSSAWHWMDSEQTLAEIARVLRSGGVLGVLWNGADRSVEWVRRLLGRGDRSPGEQVAAVGRHRFELSARVPFGNVDTCVIDWSRSMSKEELVGLAATYSTWITASADKRDAEMERVRGVLDTAELRDIIEMPMRCRCWRAIRR